MKTLQQEITASFYKQPPVFFHTDLKPAKLMNYKSDELEIFRDV